MSESKKKLKEVFEKESKVPNPQSSKKLSSFLQIFKSSKNVYVSEHGACGGKRSEDGLH